MKFSDFIFEIKWLILKKLKNVLILLITPEIAFLPTFNETISVLRNEIEM